MIRIWSIVCVLSALLVKAMLDSVPDPPAVNPTAVQCKVVHIDDISGRTIPNSSDSIGTIYSVPMGLVAAETCEPFRPSDRIVHAGQATDPSPPVTQFRCKLVSNRS
jgi:hypothetical protein